MDDIRKWDPAEVLDGIEELLNTGVTPAVGSFSLEEILSSYGEPGEEAAPQTSVQREKAAQPAPVEAPAVQPETEQAPVQEVLSPVEEPEAAPPLEELPPQAEEAAPVAEAVLVTEAAPEIEQEPEPQAAPVDQEAPAEEAQAPTQEETEPAQEEYSLEEIMQEYSDADEPEKVYSLEEILHEFSEEPAALGAETEEEEPTELDLNQMAFLIGQNVADAMMDEEEEQAEEEPEEPEETNDSTMDGLREFFEDARRRVANTVKRRSSSKKAPPPAIEEEEPSDNITAMPTPQMKAIRDSFGRIQDKMDDFADHMYADAVTEAEDLAEETVPGTDTEQIPERKEEPSISLKGRLDGFLDKKSPKAPEIPLEELARRYKLGLGFMGNRLVYLGVLLAVALYISIAAETPLPLPALLMEQRPAAAVLTWLLGMSCAVGLDVLWMGLTAPFRGRPGMHTLTALSVLATLADGLCCVTVGREGPLPFSALAMLGLFCSMLGVMWRKRALYQSCRTVSRCNDPSRVTLDENKWNGDAAFAKERGDTAGFSSQIQSMDGAQRIYRVWVPIIGVLAVAGAVMASVGHGHSGLLTWAFSGILVACAPISGLMAFAHPYSKLTRRLDHSGAVLAGWEGAESMTGKANILLTDEDLFPEGTVFQRRVAQAEGFPLEKLTACVASILYVAGSGLYHLFDGQLRRQGGSYRRVDDIQFYEAGGFSADIRGEQVLVGSYAFLNVMKVEIPEGSRVRSSVYCVINKKVGGIFSLDYSMSHNDKQALTDLVHCGIHPVLATRDFNIIPSMLQRRFDLPVEKMEYPKLERRRELSERGQKHNPVLGAILTRENVAAYADAVIGGRRLSTIVKINAIIAVMASLVGLLLGFFLVWTASFHSFTPLSMLLFLLIWAVPNVAISGAADKF